MTKPLICALLSCLFACSARRTTVLYIPPEGGFSCRVPGDWSVLENRTGAGRVSFFGPSSGPHANSAAITVYYYAPSSFSTVDAYFKTESMSGGETSALSQRTFNGRALYSFTTRRTSPILHSTRTQELREDTVVVPAHAGFYALVYAAPEHSFQEAEPNFEDFVQDFRPAS